MTCCSLPATQPRSSRGHISQHVSWMLIHSILETLCHCCGHSFPSSPLGSLKEYPSDHMNLRTRELKSGGEHQVCPDGRPGVLATLLRHRTLCCRPGMRCLPGPRQLRVPGNAGGQERERKSSAGTTCGACRCARVEEGWKCPFEKQKHCAMDQSGFTRVRDPNNSLTSGTCVLRRFVQGSAGSSPAGSAAAALRCHPAQERALQQWPS